jgi:hypothetical protein
MSTHAASTMTIFQSYLRANAPTTRPMNASPKPHMARPRWPMRDSISGATKPEMVANT